MLLQNKKAIIYGAGGSMGGAVARSLAQEGAKVFLTGTTLPPLEKVAADIIATGGLAEIALVDALDERAVTDYWDTLVNKEGCIDISFNAIDLKDVHGIPIAEMETDDFTRPIAIAMKTQFITSRAAAKHMIKKGAGVILFLTATPAGKAYPKVGGFGPACSAIEGFSRNLASELGPQGVRVVCMRSAGSPDSAVFLEAVKKAGTLADMDFQHLVKDTMLNKLPLMADIGNIAAFVCSDKASTMTGTSVNVTCGTTPD